MVKFKVINETAIQNCASNGGRKKEKRRVREKKR